MAEWLSQIEFTGMHVVCIVIFFLYILASCVGFFFLYVAGRGYTDLAKGLRRILERQDAAGKLEDIQTLSEEIQKYYNSYTKLNPTVQQRYSGIIGWMDDILLQTNMFTGSTRKRRRKFGIWFDEYYDILARVQAVFEQEYPFYRCTSNQSQLLEDIAGMRTAGNSAAVDNLLKKTEDEFIKLNTERRKNERTNYISIAIGVAGILVSVLLTVLQMFG